MITPDTPREEVVRIVIEELRWPVFVLSSTKAPVANCKVCKEPGVHDDPAEMDACECLLCHGFHAATLILERALEMLRLHPRGCLAARMGAASGAFCLDFDPDGYEARQRLVELGLLRETRAVYSGRPHGIHLYYRYPDSLVTSRDKVFGRPGVDVKGDGGYTVIPPSIHPGTGRQYQWRFDWASAPMDDVHPELLKVIQPPAIERPAPDLTPRDFDEFSHRRLRGLVNTVLHSQEGGRNSALLWASARAGEMVARGEVTEQLAYDAISSAALQAGLPIAEIGTDPHRGTFGQGLRRGMRS